MTVCLLAPLAQVSSKCRTCSVRVILQFMCVGSWTGVTNARYTVLTGPKKDETAVHCCDPALSLLVMLVSRNIFHVVSALQLIGPLKSIVIGSVHNKPFRIESKCQGFLNFKVIKK